jgi:hypothetical protein
MTVPLYKYVLMVDPDRKEPLSTIDADSSIRFYPLRPRVGRGMQPCQTCFAIVVFSKSNRLTGAVKSGREETDGGGYTNERTYETI